MCSSDLIEFLGDFGTYPSAQTNIETTFTGQAIYSLGLVSYSVLKDGPANGYFDGVGLVGNFADTQGAGLLRRFVFSDSALTMPVLLSGGDNLIEASPGSPSVFETINNAAALNYKTLYVKDGWNAQINQGGSGINSFSATFRQNEIGRAHV